MGPVSEAVRECRAAERRLGELEQSGAAELELAAARADCEAARCQYQRAYDAISGTLERLVPRDEPADAMDDPLLESLPR